VLNRIICDANCHCIIKVGGCFGLMVTKVVQCLSKIIPIWQLWNKAPSSAAAADATTNLIIIEFVWNALFHRISLLLFGIHPMKKCPHALLQAPFSGR
jgi:hypothetical protein